MVQQEKDAKLYIKGGVAFLLFMAIALFTFFCLERCGQKCEEDTERQRGKTGPSFKDHT